MPSNHRNPRRTPDCAPTPLRGPIRQAISGYRYYSPELGRWVNRDPIGKRGGVNLYIFVNNESILHFDIFGLKGLRLVYEFEDDINWFNRQMLPRGAIAVRSISEMYDDISSKIDLCSPSSDEHNTRIEYLMIGGHGSSGYIRLGESVISDEHFYMWDKSRESNQNFQSDEEKFLYQIADALCENATVVFVTCQSGKGCAGADLHQRLKSIFGEHVSVILYETNVAYLFGITIKVPEHSKE